jgi:hypothetical protein
MGGQGWNDLNVRSIGILGVWVMVFRQNIIPNATRWGRGSLVHNRVFVCLTGYSLLLCIYSYN